MRSGRPRRADPIPARAVTFGQLARRDTLGGAELRGAVVGLMSLSMRPQIRLAGLIMTVDELVVAEGARGAGVGAALIELAKSEARRAGARRLELLTARGRPSYSRLFYVKNGFAEVDSAVMRWQG